MKRISYSVNRTISGPRKARKHNAKVPTIDITSLCDILTILLVFLIKNVSMEVQKSSPPPKMDLPTSFQNEQQLQDKTDVILVRMYPDRVVYGLQSRIVGSPQDLISNNQVMTSLVNELKSDYSEVMKHDPDGQPSILFQADRQVQCEFVTAFLALASNNAGYSNIFFSTIKASDPNQIFRQE